MKRNQIYQISVVGLMAAMVFVSTNFRIPIPTPLGNTMLHFGNVFCLLSGLILGGVRGGLAAGIGSMFFDLVDPLFISSAPFTLVFKGIMGYLAGMLSSEEGIPTSSKKRMVFAAVVGSMTYVFLYIGKGFVVDYFFYRNPIETVLIASGQKAIVSLVNAVIAVVVSVILAPTFTFAMKRSGIWEKLYPHK